MILLRTGAITSRACIARRACHAANAALVRRCGSMNQRIMIIAISMTCVAICTVLFAFNIFVSARDGRETWTNQSVASSIQYGNTVVSAINSYYDANGTYPQKLELLLPQYLQAIPLPTAGTRMWKYTIAPDQQSYTLQFSMNKDLYPSVYWNSKMRTWVHDN